MTGTTTPYRVTVERVATTDGYAWSVQAVTTDPDGIELHRAVIGTYPSRPEADAAVWADQAADALARAVEALHQDDADAVRTWTIWARVHADAWYAAAREVTP